MNNETSEDKVSVKEENFYENLDQFKFDTQTADKVFP